MSNRTSAQAFGAAASGLVHAQPVADILSRLLKDCVEVVGAEAAAVLVLDERDRLSLLSSSSAAATHLELLQASDVQGPCVDVIRTGETQSAAGREEMTHRWGEVGAAITAAGFVSVDAFPMTWRGRVLGGLNIFGNRPLVGSDRDQVCQGFADVATIVLAHAEEISPDELTARVQRALGARDQIEQAKGVLSQLDGPDMEQAAIRLEEMAASAGTTLSEAALRIIDGATSDRLRPAGGPVAGA